MTHYDLFTVCIAACEKVAHHELAVASRQRALREGNSHFGSESRNLSEIVQRNGHTVRNASQVSSPGPCLRVIPRRLLQCNLCWGAEECNRQATTSAERGRTHCQWHTEIRSRSDGSHANELHWLDVPDRVKYKLGMLMYRCQHNQAPRYLMDDCSPVSDVVFRQRLRSANFPCHFIGSAPTAVGRFLLLDQLFGTHCLMTYVIRNVLETFSDSR